MPSIGQNLQPYTGKVSMWVKNSRVERKTLHNHFSRTKPCSTSTIFTIFTINISFSNNYNLYLINKFEKSVYYGNILQYDWLIIKYFTAVIWPKYFRYGVSYYIIYQSILNILCHIYSFYPFTGRLWFHWSWSVACLKALSAMAGLIVRKKILMTNWFFVL